VRQAQSAISRTKQNKIKTKEEKKYE